MSLVDQTPRSQTASLAFELDLPHAPEKVWRALTDPTLIVQSGFQPDQKQSFGGARYGWRLMGDRLAKLLEVA